MVEELARGLGHERLIQDPYMSNRLQLWRVSVWGGGGEIERGDAEGKAAGVKVLF